MWKTVVLAKNSGQYNTYNYNFKNETASQQIYGLIY